MAIRLLALLTYLSGAVTILSFWAGILLIAAPDLQGKWLYVGILVLICGFLGGFFACLTFACTWKHALRHGATAAEDTAVEIHSYGIDER
jgi:hypothetical protein